jgi:hypothetical protein
MVALPMKPEEAWPEMFAKGLIKVRPPVAYDVVRRARYLKDCEQRKAKQKARYYIPPALGENSCK